MRNETVDLRFLFLICIAFTFYPMPLTVQAQENALPPPVEIYRDALDPSKPADKPLPNPLTYFDVRETRKTVTKMPGSLYPPEAAKARKAQSRNHIFPEKHKSATVPVPPKKPRTLHASEKFIDEARKTEAKIPAPSPTARLPQAPEKPVAKPAVIEPVIAAPAKPKPVSVAKFVSKDVFAENLVEPSLQDILKTIDPKAAGQSSKLSNDSLSLGYQAEVVSLPGNIKDILAGGLVSRLKADPVLRLEIMAYASSPANDKSEARRISLERASIIKDFLLEKGIEPQRIDIRPMGLAERTNRQADRVDLYILKP